MDAATAITIITALLTSPCWCPFAVLVMLIPFAFLEDVFRIFKGRC